MQVAVGRNGRVWVKGKDSYSTVVVVNCLQRAEFLSHAQQETLVKKALATAAVA